MKLDILLPSIASRAMVISDEASPPMIVFAPVVGENNNFIQRFDGLRADLQIISGYQSVPFAASP